MRVRGNRGTAARVLSAIIGVAALTSSVLVVGLESAASAANVTGAVTVGTNPLDVALNPVNPVAYVANFTSNNVSVIDLSNNTVTATIPVGTGPSRVVVNAAGTVAYVANFTSNNISAINLSNDTVQTIALPPNAGPEQIFLDSSDNAYVVDRGLNQISVINNLSTTPVLSATTYVTGSTPEGIFVNGTDAYVTNRGDGTVSVINLSTGITSPTITVGASPSRIAANPAGTFLYVTNRGSHNVSVISTSTNAVVATVPVGYTPDAVVVDPSNTYAYVSNTDSADNSVSVISTSTYAVVQTIPVGADPEGITVNAAGTFAYVANYASNNVSIIAVSTNPYFQVTFNGNGATSGTMAIESNNMAAPLTPNAFVRTSYTFTGWNTAADGSGTAYTNAQTYPFTASTTLYAQWTRDVDAYSYAPGTGGTGTAPASGSGLDGTTITLAPNTFSRAGYYFMGWSDGVTTHPAGYVYTLTSGGAPIVFTAQWTSSVDAYSYAPGTGGTGTAPAPGSGANGTTITLAKNPFTRPGYAFTGWNDGNAVHPAGSVYTLASNGAPIVFTAQWTVVPPLSPTRLVATLGKGTISLRWNTPTNDGATILGYNVYRGTSSGHESSTPLNGASLVAGTSFKVTRLSHGVKYFFIVRAVSTGTKSAASNQASVSVPTFASTHTALSLSKSKVAYASQHTVRFNVRVTARGAARALSGVVKIKAGSRVLCVAKVSSNGMAHCSLPKRALREGLHRIVAFYGGDWTDHGSKSSPVKLRIV